MPTSRKPPPRSPSEPEPETDIPSLEPKDRSRQMKKLESSVEGFYVMLGGAMTVLPAQIAGERMRYVGISLANHSSGIASAWIDLAEDDPRVKRGIESIAGFSAWGKVVGEHLSTIGEATPGIANRRGQPQAESPDIEAMMGLAQSFAQSAAAERANGPAQPPQQPAPSPEVQQRMEQEQNRQQQRPQRQQQQQPVPQAPAPVSTQRRPVGMPSPADLGVSIAPEDEVFPTSGPENVRG